MAVKFISEVEQDKNGGWFINLTDTLEEITVVCKDLQEYKIQIETLGAEYGGDIEVIWTKSKLLTPINYQDLQEKMVKFRDEYKDEIDKMNNTNSDVNNELSGFNPND